MPDLELELLVEANVEATTVTTSGNDLEIELGSTSSSGTVLDEISLVEISMPPGTESGGGGGAPVEHVHDSRYVVVVEHGTDANTARPVDAVAVLWIGTVEPNNSLPGDQWDNASGSPAVYMEEPAEEGTAGWVLTTDGAGGRSWAAVPTSGGGGGVQPGDDAADLGSGAAPDGRVLTSDGTGGAAWEALPSSFPANGDAADLTSGSATDGFILTADGAGGAAWEAPPAGGGGGTDQWTYVISSVDTANSAVTPVNITGLSVTGLPNGLYEMEFMVLSTSALVGTGPQIAITFPTSAPWVGYMWGIGTSGSASVFRAVASDEGTGSARAASTGTGRVAPALNIAAFGKGVVRANSMGAGVIALTIQSETAASEVTAKPDSYIRYRKIA